MRMNTYMLPGWMAGRYNKEERLAIMMDHISRVNVRDKALSIRMV